MSEFGYKVVMTNEQCLVKRFSAFHSDQELNQDEISEEACRHLSSQTCPRCGENHEPSTYFPTGIQMALV